MTGRSSPPPLADANERTRFESELNQNFCVSASAGAGKTTAIVRRIAALILAGENSPDDPAPRLVVVTYTRAAAAELRFRARAELQRDHTISPELLARRLRRLNSAFFGTLHSFTLALLRRHGGALGLPADAELLEEAKASELWNQFTSDEKFLPSALSNPWIQASLRHASLDDVFALARSLSAAEASDLFPKNLAPPESSPLDPQAIDAITKFTPSRRSEKNATNNRQILLHFISSYQANEPFVPIPKIENGGKDIIELANQLLQPVRCQHAECLARAAAVVAEAFLSYRIAQGQMTYDDMIYWGRRLADDPTTLDEMRARQFIILLDEAQDTEPDMFDLLLELARPPNSRVGTWPDQPDAPPPEPGRFCFVGDDQQTIYGDARHLQHYQHLVETFRAGQGGEALEFSVTMRLSQACVEAVNRVFNGRPVHLPAAANSPTFRTLQARPQAPPGKTTHLWVLTSGQENLSHDERLRQEAIRTGLWLKQQGLAKLGVDRWSSVAVLAARNEWLDHISRGLVEAGLPVEQLASKQPRKDLPGFSWPLALLRVLVRPDDSFELIGVLREVFVISDRVLAQAQLDHPGCLQLNDRPPRQLSQPLAEALNQLFTLREQITAAGTYLPVAQALEKVRSSLLLDARLQVASFDLAPLAWLADQAAIAEASGQPLTKWVDQMHAASHQPLPLAPQGDAIHLLNCHKAKGLEWDVVALVGLARKLGRGSEKYPRIERTKLGLQIALQKEDLETLDQKEEEHAAENARLLYVAMTRAKKHLVLADAGPIWGKGQPFLTDTSPDSMFHQLGIARTDPILVQGPPAEPEPESPSPSPSAPAAQPLTAPPPPTRLRPSSLSHPEPAHRQPEDDREVPEFEQSIGGVDYGNWWHQTMQNFPWKDTQKAQQSYAEDALHQADALGFGPRARTELNQLFQADFWKSWAEPRCTVLTEVPFLHPAHPNQWLDGVIDCLVTRPEIGHYLVLDWKTDRPLPQETPAALATRLTATYGPQLHAYRSALLSLPGATHCQLALYSTSFGMLIHVEPSPP